MNSAQLPLLDEVRWTFYAGEREAFQLGDELTTVEWAEARLRLPPSITEIHGPWRCSVTPYAREPIDLWDDPHVRRSVKCWAPQTAKTMTSYLPVLRRLAMGQGPALLVMSGEAGARKMFRDYIGPIALASPGLKRLLLTSREDMTSSTLRFLGDRGRFDAAWATSLPRLKSFSYRIALGDEVEDWPAAVEAGGDPEALLDVRTRFYPHTSRIELVSSPGSERGIWSKLLECQEVRVYLARCPHCGAEQRLTWPEKASPFYPRWEFDPRADPGEIEGEQAARYLCAGCDARWTSSDRDRAVREGRWSAADKRYFTPEHWYDPFPAPPPARSLRPVSVGFHLAAWYSRLVPLAKVVSEFLRAEKTPDPVERRERLRAWTNNYPAHPWREELPPPVEAASVLALRDARPACTAPNEALLLVASADVQEAGIWYEIRAWAANRTSWLVRYGFLARNLGEDPAPTTEDGIVLGRDLLALETICREEAPTPEGELLPVRFGLIDCRYRTAEVLAFCRRFRTIAPAMGFESRRSAVTYAKQDTYPGSSKLIRGGLLRVDVDVTYFKDALAARLRVTPGDPGSWILHVAVGSDYAQQYTSETKDETTGLWKQRGRQPNHLWDCGVYQLAAVHVLEAQGVFSRLLRPQTAASDTTPTPAPRPSDRIKRW